MTQSASKEMAVYCFDTLVAHYTGDAAPPPGFEEGHFPLFVTWKKILNGGEPRLRGCIGTLEARTLITGFKDYALTRGIWFLEHQCYTSIDALGTGQAGQGTLLYS
jgi:AMMECR1 domain-containing protein